MFGCECFYWNRVSDVYPSEPQPFSLPSPLPEWPEGEGFATGRIRLGELEVLKITDFEIIWSFNPSRGKLKGITFYKPLRIPESFFSLGYYSQPNDKPLKGYVLVAREIGSPDPKFGSPLQKPISYTLIWSTDSDHDGSAYFWLPNPPRGYKPMGFLVTRTPNEPFLEEVRCVRADLTERCETCDVTFEADSNLSKDPFRVWNIRPFRRGILGKGVSVGTFFCATFLSKDADLNVACLKNCDSSLHAMPNLNQIHCLINHFGPTVYFHPDEVYMPSSVSWFFKNGALLYRSGKDKGEPINSLGSNLPRGGSNDGEFWIGLPNNSNDDDNTIKRGNIDSAELYIHVKPALGGTFTDIVMWVFCPFNGPATLKVGLISIPMNKIGEHVGDWEHFTLRISNFTGELWSVYFSQHSGGEWIEASELEFIEGNRPIVYSSKGGHASFPHPGSYIRGSSKLGIGVRNDAAKSKYYVDSSIKYKVIAAEYLGNGVDEPYWLEYMREWGPTVVYDSRSELDKIINLLPPFVRFSVENLFDLFPTEIYGEEGPTGPKEKNNWSGDERW